MPAKLSIPPVKIIYILVTISLLVAGCARNIRAFWPGWFAAASNGGLWDSLLGEGRPTPNLPAVSAKSKTGTSIVAAIKQLDGPGVIYIPGSGNLAQSLIKQNLIDEYRLWIHPIMLGSGKRLFPEGKRINLKLVESVALPTGVVYQRYQLA